MGVQTKDGYIPSATEVVKGHVMRSMAQKNDVPKKPYAVWLSFDLGFEEGTEKRTEEQCAKEYQDRYRVFGEWLKSKQAKECGYSVALFLYFAQDGSVVSKELKAEIQRVFKDGKIEKMDGIRFYAIVASIKRLPEGKIAFDKVIDKRFIIGRRRDTNPWD